MEQMKANLGRLGSFTERAVTFLIPISIYYLYILIPICTFIGKKYTYY